MAQAAGRYYGLVVAVLLLQLSLAVAQLETTTDAEQHVTIGKFYFLIF